MQQTPRLGRYWLLLGILVVLDLILAAVILGWMRDSGANPLAMLAESPSELAVSSLTPNSLISLPFAIEGKPIVTATAIPSATPEVVRPLTLDDIFPPRDISHLNLDPKRLRTLIATGDVVPARATDRIIRARGDDYTYTVAATKDVLASADITVINLEAPLIEKCPPHDSGMTFCGRPGFVKALSVAGVDVVTLENNHVRNYGTEGITETIKNLQAASIAWSRGDSPAVMNVRGVKFGFLAFNAVGERINRQTMATRIQVLHPQVDVLVAAIHWGAEYTPMPAAAPGIAPDNPVEIAHFAVDNGVDLIIGNHPHRIQGIELYKGKLIAYAHGNFIFDQMWSDKTRQGVIGVYTFYDRTLVKVQYMPVMIQNYAQPVLLEGKASAEVLDKMKAASRELSR